MEVLFAAVFIIAILLGCTAMLLNGTTLQDISSTPAAVKIETEDERR